MIVILSGVSGSGKDTIKRMLIEDSNNNIVTMPSYTTRPKRTTDKEGQYVHVTFEEFEKHIANNDLYEYSMHHDNYYGTSKKILDKVLKAGHTVVKDIDVNGTELLKEVFKDSKVKIISIFLNVSKDEMIKRLKQRGDMVDWEDLELRISRYEYEVSKLASYDYVIKNDDATKTMKIIEDIIQREKEF